ncbi:MAG TPA: hypothetical protein VLL47_09290 [Robiginitalea sp.]|nr:hypothetical protein [Robiginitalea sp.]
MMRKAFLVCLLAGACACGRNEKEATSTYFAGEIVNPTSEYVVLYRGEDVLDSARLNSDNRFEIRVDSLAPGLYHFLHRPEMQYVYLEPGDSLQMRLNTVSFDESLAFSGTGEVINNYLINLFLEAEGEESVIRDSYIPMEPGVFLVRMDSLKEAKLAGLEQLREEENMSEGAFDVARASIQYKNYYYRESYPFWHRRLSPDKTFHELPDHFYDYRASISYDDPKLVFLRPYYEFMIYHIGNLAFMGCQNSCEADSHTVKNQLHFNRHQLHLIDSLVNPGELRDNLFRTVAFEYLLKNDSEENFDKFMEDFHRMSGNNRHLGEIEELSDGIRNLRPNLPMPALQVLNTDDQPVLLGDIRPERDQSEVVFYFWSGPEPKHLKSISEKVSMLEERHPELRFVGICLRTDKEQWKNLIGEYGLDPQWQYWAEDFESFAHTLVVYHPYKSIVTRNGLIIDGFANLNTSF